MDRSKETNCDIKLKYVLCMQCYKRLKLKYNKNSNKFHKNRKKIFLWIKVKSIRVHNVQRID